MCTTIHNVEQKESTLENINLNIEILDLGNYIT
jgi:hypothetical protein